MQSASSRIWTRIAVSISYEDNHYTTGTSTPNEIFIDSNILVFLSGLWAVILDSLFSYILVEELPMSKVRNV